MNSPPKLKPCRWRTVRQNIKTTEGKKWFKMTIAGSSLHKTPFQQELKKRTTTKAHVSGARQQKNT
jgi:hypothetical protein